MDRETLTRDSVIALLLHLQIQTSASQHSVCMSLEEFRQLAAIGRDWLDLRARLESQDVMLSVIASIVGDEHADAALHTRVEFALAERGEHLERCLHTNTRLAQELADLRARLDTLSLSVKDDAFGIGELLADQQREKERLHEFVLGVMRALGPQAKEAQTSEYPAMIEAMRARLDAAEQEREKLAKLLHQYQYPDLHLQGAGSDCNFTLTQATQEPPKE